MFSLSGFFPLGDNFLPCFHRIVKLRYTQRHDLAEGTHVKWDTNANQKLIYSFGAPAGFNFVSPAWLNKTANVAAFFPSQ